MNWRAIFAVAISVFLATGFMPAFSQGGTASVSLNHSYRITALGYAVLNDTLTFTAGSAAATVPTVHLGIPNSIYSRSSDVTLAPSGAFTMSTSQANGSTLVALTPSQSSLSAGANLTVSLKAIVTGIFNYSAGGYVTKAPALVLLSPSLDVNVTEVTSSIILPPGGFLAQTPSGFTAPTKNATAPAFTSTKASVIPGASSRYLNFTDSTQTGFTPVEVLGLTRTVVPSANGSPIVEDSFTLHNLAAYPIGSIDLHLVDASLTQVKVIPNTVPPLLNPQLVPLSSVGALVFADTTLAGPLVGLSNMSLQISYRLPASLVSTSGGAVTVKIPTAPIIAAPVVNYTIGIAASKGLSVTGQASYTGQSFNPFTPSTVSFTYSVSLGWAADQALPAAALIFVVAFALFAIQRPVGKREDEKVIRSIPDVLKSFEVKTGLETQYMAELGSASKGSISKTEFDKMRNEVSDLRSRAISRLMAMRLELGSGKQFELLGHVGEAEKEEDRAFRDLLNLYLQYHGSRMNDETFKRLQPSYKKRVDTAVNRLSDLLHEVQEEER